MMTKFMNKQRGLLAAIMALVMVFAGAAFVAADVDASDNTPVAKIGETEFLTLDAAIVEANSMSNATIEILNDATYNGTSPQEGMTIDGKNKQITFNEKMRIGSKTVGGQFTLKDATIVIADSCHSMFLDTQSGDYYGQNVNVLIQNITITSEKTDLTIYFNGWDGRTYTLDNVSGTYKAVLSGISGIPSMELSKIQGIDVEVTTEGSETVALSTTNDAKINVLGSKGGVSVTVMEKSNLTVTTLEDVTVNASGTIKYDNIVGESKVVSGNVVVDKQGAIVDSFEDAALAFSAGAKDVILGKEDNGKFVNSTVYLNNNEFTVPAGNTLTINNATVYSYNEPEEGTGATDIGSIKVLGTLYLESADVRASISTEGDDAEIIVIKAKKMTVTGDSTADLGVGYGNTLVLADLIVPAGKYIEAYGTVIIEGTVTVQSKNGFHIYEGGYAQIDGALVIEGTATIDGEADVNGSVKVYNKDGGASFNVGEKGEVDVAGTMDVLKGTTKNTTNTLNVEGDLNIEGTLTITGTLEGTVNDMGTIVFNGIASADGATIKVFDGITLNVASVTGTLTVTDAGIIDTEGMANLKYAISASNEVTLTDVKGVTISVAVDETVKKVDEKYNEGINEVVVEDVKYRFYTTTMTVNGALADNDSKVARMEIENNLVSGNWFNDADDDKINIITWPKGLAQNNIIVEDLTVGKNVAVEFAGTNIDIAGTVTVVAEDASITIDSTVAYVDLMGSIIIGDDAYYNPTGTGDSKKSGSILAVNGAHYTVQSADMTEYTEYYVTLAAALAATDAYENQIDIIGEITVDEALEIVADKEVLMDKASELTIDVDGTVTVAAGALLDASDAKITVKGMLVIMDKESGLDANNGKDMFIYQVVTETDDSITYSGLVLALQNAVSGDTITITGQTAEISESVTIPEGVTLVVPAQSKLTVGSETEDVTLTINGVLDVQRSGILANETASYKETIVINGVLKDGAETANLITTFGMEDFVAFEMKIDGRLIDAYSNLAFASENFSGETITIYGDVSAGDITFDAGDDALTIQFAYITQMVNSTPTVIESSLSIGTMTLVGENITILTIEDTNATPVIGKGFITGTVASAAGSMDLNKVTGITISTAVDEDVEGTTDLLYVNGTLDGKMTVATGTVTMDADLTVGTDKDDILTIASGATLSNGGKILTVEDAAISASVKQYAALIVDGTLSVVKGKITVNKDSDSTGNNYANGKVIINGTLSIAESETSAIDGEMVVLGQLAINDTEEKAASLTVVGKLEIGAVPALGANASVSGPIAISGANASVIVYEGADISAAIIDPKADDTTGAKYTDIKVNGTEFMTVYVDKDNTSAVTLQSTLPDIEGYDVAKADWTANGSKITGTTVTVGTYEMAEATLPASKIGLTVSAGVGLKVYIDGLSVDAYYTIYGDDTQKAYWISLGTHTVSIGVESGYDGSAATITVNGVQVSNNGTFTVDVDDKEVVIIASGAVPAQSGSTVVVDDADDGMALTDILLIVLVVLIVIMAIIVALRMMRS